MKLADLRNTTLLLKQMLHVTTLKAAILKQQHLEFRVNETLKLMCFQPNKGHLIAEP